jgi:WD40 repeat protein
MMISSVYALAAPVPPPAPAALLWADPTVATNGIALSRDGQYVAVGTDGAVMFYGRSSSTPLWIYSSVGTDFHSVAISADGNYVAAGTLGKVYFWANARSLAGNPSPTWTSRQVVGDYFERRCLTISADGNYVAACGTGMSVFYWAGAAGKSGSDIDTTWVWSLAFKVEAMAVSDDGNHVAAAGYNPGTPNTGVLGYWNDATHLTGHPAVMPTWRGQETGETFVDVAISNDGNYVAAASGGLSTVYYWAGALTRSTQTESHTWAGNAGVPFSSIDMSSSGDSVIAGGEDGVYFWSGARALTGTPTQTWKYSTTNPAYDVAIDSAGDYMAACTASFATLYFFDNTGSVKWSYEIDADKLSISSDGATLAVGTPALGTALLMSTGFPMQVTPSGPVGPVGGFMEPVNKLAVFAPYLALFGVMAVVVVAVAPWKKRES